MKKFALIFSLLVLSLIVAACGGGEAEPSTEMVAAGEAIFNSPVIEGQAGCVTCHSTDPDTVLVGPSMAGIATARGRG